MQAIQAIDTSDLVKKAESETKIKEIEDKISDHNKYDTTQEFNKLTVENFGKRLKQENLAIKEDIVGFVKKTYVDKN